MADNRLYLVHKHTKRCVCIGKTLGDYIPYTPESMNLDSFYNSLSDNIYEQCLNEKEALSFYIVTENDGDIIEDNGLFYFIIKKNNQRRKQCQQRLKDVLSK